MVSHCTIGSWPSWIWKCKWHDTMHTDSRGRGPIRTKTPTRRRRRRSSATRRRRRRSSANSHVVKCFFNGWFAICHPTVTEITWLSCTFDSNFEAYKQSLRSLGGDKVQNLKTILSRGLTLKVSCFYKHPLVCMFLQRKPRIQEVIKIKGIVVDDWKSLE